MPSTRKLLIISLSQNSERKSILPPQIPRNTTVNQQVRKKCRERTERIENELGKEKVVDGEWDDRRKGVGKYLAAFEQRETSGTISSGTGR